MKNAWQKFNQGEKVYAVWDLLQPHQWDPMDVYDASPAGLSGTKEGFYFGNWLMPFTIPFRIDRVSISPENYPPCLDQNVFPCDRCNFFGPETCPIMADKANHGLTQLAFQLYQKLIYVPRGIGDIGEILQKELLDHGRPLHFSLLTRIIIDRYAMKDLSTRTVHQTLRVNPIFFADVGDGVYQAIKGRDMYAGGFLSFMIGELF
jgi:hypothetical protein